MKGPLPLGARKVGLIWPILEGGFGTTASTDITGQPIIGIYPLNCDGKPSGQETQYAYERLLIRVVAGYDHNHKAIIVFADIELTSWGMFLRVLVPPYMIARGLDNHQSVKWGSKQSMLLEAPANANWPVDPVTREV